MALQIDVLCLALIVFQVNKLQLGFYLTNILIYLILPNKLRIMKQEEHIKYWLKSAEHDLESAETLFENRRYDWCLFLGHLVLEKVLKAFFCSR